MKKIQILYFSKEEYGSYDCCANIQNIDTLQLSVYMETWEEYHLFCVHKNVSMAILWNRLMNIDHTRRRIFLWDYQLVIPYEIIFGQDI